MNTVLLTGRLTKDVEFTQNEKYEVSRFSIAVSKGKEKGADFLNVVAWGNQAKHCNKYLKKGLKVLVQGHLKTGDFTNKEGVKKYTVDVICDRIEFLEWIDDTKYKDLSIEKDFSDEIDI